MSTKYPGGIISKTAPTPSGPYSTDTAPGIWTLEQQAYWQKLGQWPTQGNVDPSAFIENLFSTYLYTGNGSTQTITNGIDLAGKGGLVWVKPRSVADWHNLYDTARGASKSLATNATDAQYDLAGNGVSAFGSTGFTINGSNDQYNTSGQTYASWTFRKQPKFFDVVTYTGDGGTQNIAHSLGSTPGCIIVKRTNTTGSWRVFHTSVSTQYGNLNSTAAFQPTSAENVWGNNSTTVAPTSTQFTVGNDSSVNASGSTYVAYLFAHDAGGFGLTGTDNVISCGSFTTNGSGQATVNLGYEPQWVLFKPSSTTGEWTLLDTMRGWVADGTNADKLLYANNSDAEIGAYNMGITATGFDTRANLGASQTHIYIAIRRGPMKVPTSGTSVFSAQTGTYSAGDSLSVGFPADMYIDAWRTGTLYKANYSRLVNFANSNSSASQNYLKTNTTDAEVTTSQAPSLYDLWNTTAKVGSWNAGVSEVWWMFRRAPSFFDEVCYTGTGSQQNITHNLGVAPELMIVKRRSAAGGSWATWATSLTADQSLALNTTDDKTAVFSVGFWGSTYPTSSVFTVGSNVNTNSNTVTYVAYLFATCAGVSKVGSYTGTGTTLQVNCGFTGGARFVLIKRTDSTGDWYVWDSARGIVAGNDPYLLLNSTAAEVTGTDYVDTYSAGFEISSTAPSAINASGGTFIFLAIA